jgi:hypothetical protein
MSVFKPVGVDWTDNSEEPLSSMHWTRAKGNRRYE